MMKNILDSTEIELQPVDKALNTKTFRNSKLH